MIRMLPTWMIKRVLNMVSFLGCELGLSIPFLGVKPYPFGSCLVCYPPPSCTSAFQLTSRRFLPLFQLTSVGGLGLDTAFAPFTPFANVPVLIAVGECKEQVIAENGVPVVKAMLPITATIDHRYLDGAQAVTIAKVLRLVFTNPRLLDEM